MTKCVVRLRVRRHCTRRLARTLGERQRRREIAAGLWVENAPPHRSILRIRAAAASDTSPRSPGKKPPMPRRGARRVFHASG